MVDGGLDTFNKDNFSAIIPLYEKSFSNDSKSNSFKYIPTVNTFYLSLLKMKKGYAERCYSGRTQTEFEVKLVKQFADQNNLKY